LGRNITSSFGPVLHFAGLERAGYVYRLCLALAEAALNARRGVDYRMIAIIVAVHVGLASLPLGPAVLLHCAVNFFLKHNSFTTFRSEYYVVEESDIPDQTLRSYDMDIGDVTHENIIQTVDFTFITETRMFGWVVITHRDTKFHVPFSWTLFCHLLSKRNTPTDHDSPDLVRNRLESSLRSFSGLGDDVSLSHQRWASSTFELAVAHVLHTSKRALGETPSFVHAAIYETARQYLPEPRDTFPHRIIASRPIDLNVSAKAVSKQIFASPGSLYKAHPTDPLMLLAGARKRLAVRMPTPCPVALAHASKTLDRFLAARGIEPLSPDTDLDFDKWLAQRPYPQSRKDELKRAHESTPSGPTRKHLIAKSFAKDEGYPEPKWPRWINSRTDVYKCFVGPVISAIEHVLFQQPDFVKYVPASDRARYIQEILSQLPGDLLATDYTSYESTHGPDVLAAIVGRFYLYMTSRHPEARRRMIFHLRARMGPQKLRMRDFTILLGRAILLSGEMDTSLNNGLCNLITFYALYTEHVPDFDFQTVLGVFEGDDGLCRVPKQFIPTTADYERYGAKCKIELPSRIELASFCGCVVDTATNVLVTDPAMWLAELPYTKRTEVLCTAARARLLVLARAMSAAYQYNGCPVISPIAWSIIRKNADLRPAVLDFASRSRSLAEWDRINLLASISYVSSHEEIAPRTSSRVIVENVFKLGVKEQVRLEALVPALPATARYTIAYDWHPGLEDFRATNEGRPMHTTGMPARRHHPLHRYYTPSLTLGLNLMARGFADPATVPCHQAKLSDTTVFSALVERFMNAKALTPAPPSKAAKLEEIRRVARGDPQNARPDPRRVQGPPPSDAGRRERKAQNEGAPQRGRVMARLGNWGRQEIRAPAPQARGNGAVKIRPVDTLALARIFSNAVAPPLTGRNLPVRRVEGPELAELARSAGVDPASLPKNTAYFVSPPAGNAVVQTNDLTSVTPHVGGHELKHPHGSVMNDDGTMTFSGSELLDTIAFPPPIGGVDSEIPAGGFLSLMPANPRFIDGCRLGAFLSTFDQFCLEEVIYEYIPGASFTTPGQLMLAYINDVSDEILQETGLAVLRDAYTRSGAILFSVVKNAHIRIGRPLFKWFFTNTDLDTALEMPGMIVLLNQLDTVTDTASVPLGSLVMHYRVRVRAPAFSQGNFTSYTAQSTSLSMENAVLTANATAYVTVANSLLPVNLTYSNAVYWGIIAAASDPAGVTSWRDWLNPQNGNSRLFDNGQVLFWRVDGNTSRVYFYSTLAEALESLLAPNGVNRAWLASTTVAPGVAKGFKLWNISGTDYNGHNAA